MKPECSLTFVFETAPFYTSTNNKYRSGMWLTNFENIPSRADENLSESVLQPTTISERGLR
jgi:hypothetical protein